MKMTKKLVVSILPSLLLAACAAPLPNRPSVAVMPTPGKPFEIFQAEEAECSRYARSQMGTSPTETQEQQVAVGTISGAMIGAVAGAAMGGNSRAAATGAGMGAVMGTATGTGNAARAGNQLQRRYDIAYEQCMYAKGNQIPTVHSPYRTDESTPAARTQSYPPPNARPSAYPPPSSYPPPNIPPPTW